MPESGGDKSAFCFWSEDGEIHVFRQSGLKVLELCLGAPEVVGPREGDGFSTADRFPVRPLGEDHRDQNLS